MEEETELRRSFDRIGTKLDEIIEILRGKQKEPSKTRVYYLDGSTAEYEIEGELGENSIPDKTNAVKVEIGNSITSIGNRTFRNCSKLTSVEIPDSVVSIGDFAFQNCSELTSMIVDADNTIYDSRNNCNAIVQTVNNTLLFGCKNTVIPEGVTKIGKNAFIDCSGLTSVVIPNTVATIDDYAFSNCSGLVSTIVGNGVTSIGDFVFFNCAALTSVTLGTNVANIGQWTFMSCSTLSSITSLGNSAPSTQTYTFGTSSSDYTGRTTYSTGSNVLRISQSAIGYDASYWADPLQNSTKCGFHIEYI